MINEIKPKPFKTLLKEHILDYFDKHDSVDEINQLHSTIIQEVEKLLIEVTLKKTNQNKLQAARILGINRNTLTQKIKNLVLKDKN